MRKQYEFRPSAIETRLGLGLASTLLVAACSSGPSGGGMPSATPSRSTRPPTPTTQPMPDMLRWPGTPRDRVPFPGRLALPENTCERWGVNRPQPIIMRGGKILTVVDARRSVPPDCDYETDEGMGTYSGASYSSNAEVRSDGTTHIPDGTVVRVAKYALGEWSCNNGGGSDLWLGVQEQPRGQIEWGWDGNFGGAPALRELRAAHVPEVQSSYAGTRLPSC